MVAAVVVAACGSGAADTTAGSGPSKAEIDMQYVAELRAWSSESVFETVIDVYDDKELVLMGEGVCDDLAHDLGPIEVLDRMSRYLYDGPVKEDMARNPKRHVEVFVHVIGVSVETYCPWLPGLADA